MAKKTSIAAVNMLCFSPREKKKKKTKTCPRSAVAQTRKPKSEVVFLQKIASHKKKLTKFYRVKKEDLSLLLPGRTKVSLLS